MEKRKNVKGVTMSVQTVVIIVLILLGISLLALVAIKAKDFNVNMLTNVKNFISGWIYD